MSQGRAAAPPAGGADPEEGHVGQDAFTLEQVERLAEQHLAEGAIRRDPEFPGIDLAVKGCSGFSRTLDLWIETDAGGDIDPLGGWRLHVEGDEAGQEAGPDGARLAGGDNSPYGPGRPRLGVFVNIKGVEKAVGAELPPFGIGLVPRQDDRGIGRATPGQGESEQHECQNEK